MAGSPQHGQLTGGVVAVLTFDRDFDKGEVLNRDGTDEIWGRFGTVDPTVGGTGCFVLPAAVNADVLDVYTSGNTVVRLISAGTPKYSVRGIG